MLFVFILYTSCNKKKNETKTNKFKLTVNIKNVPDSTKVYLYDEDIEIKLDSSYITNESFEFSGKVDFPSLCYLFLYDNENNRSEHYKNLFLENKKISVVGEYSDFFNAKVTGSKQTNLLTKYYSISAKSDKSKKFYNQVNFLYSNANNQATLNELLYKKKDISKDSLLIFYERLDSINSISPKGKELLTYIKTDQIKIGDKFKDISGQDSDGMQHKLSDYYGKIILLNFWSPGCAFCMRQKKKEFPKLISKYNQEDFIIISYNVDKIKDGRKIINDKKHKNWLNISDFKGIKGENISKYDVVEIPNNFLIDKNGIIVKSFTGFREEETKIEEEIDKLIL